MTKDNLSIDGRLKLAYKKYKEAFEKEYDRVALEMLPEFQEYDPKVTLEDVRSDEVFWGDVGDKMNDKFWSEIQDEFGVEIVHEDITIFVGIPEPEGIYFTTDGKIIELDPNDDYIVKEWENKRGKK